MAIDFLTFIRNFHTLQNRREKKTTSFSILTSNSNLQTIKNKQNQKSISFVCLLIYFVFNFSSSFRIIMIFKHSEFSFLIYFLNSHWLAFQKNKIQKFGAIFMICFLIFQIFKFNLITNRHTCIHLNYNH